MALISSEAKGMAGLFGAPEESEAVRSLCNSGTLAAPALAAKVGWNRLPRPHARPFSSGRTAAFAASIFAALRLTGRLSSGSLVASPGPTERSGSARTGLSPVRSHALPSLLARSPGGRASYGGDLVLAKSA